MSARKPRLLWWGDAVTATGFSRVTHSVLEQLAEAWDVHVLGINYQGDPHHYGYPIFPALLGGDLFGHGRARGLCEAVQPDVVLCLNDPWNVAEFLKVIPPAIPVVGYMPVDGRNCRFGRALNGLAMAIGYTEFGLEELRKSGFSGPAAVIPHGVDTAIFKPFPRPEARQRLGLEAPDVRARLGLAPGDEYFLFGNVNRNQDRKRLDLSVAYFARWWRAAGMPRNAFLYLHCSLQDKGWELKQLAAFYGIAERLMLSNGGDYRPGTGVPDADLAMCYAAFDVQISTTQGEGWGLTTHEGMACGIPQILPDWSALGEWTRGAAYLVPCSTTATTPNGINAIGGIADPELFAAAMDRLYRDARYREALGRLALERATEPRFSWPAIGRQFHEVLSLVLAKRQAAAAAAQPKEAQTV
jgi:D-inositol-3-phosphate glycosyltransferase